MGFSCFCFSLRFSDITRKIRARTLMKVVSTMDLKEETRISKKKINIIYIMFWLLFFWISKYSRKMYCSTGYWLVIFSYDNLCGGGNDCFNKFICIFQNKTVKCTSLLPWTRAAYPWENRSKISCTVRNSKLTSSANSSNSRTQVHFVISLASSSYLQRGKASFYCFT